MSLKTKQVYEFGAFRLDASERLLFQNQVAVPLPPKVIETLLALVESNGQLLEKEALLKRVWPDTFVEENNLNKNVSALRKALGEGQGEQKYIETVPKRGYRFVAKVSLIQEGGEEELILERTKARLLIEEEQEAYDPAEETVQASAIKAEERSLITDGRTARRRTLPPRSIILAVALVALLAAAGVGVWMIRRGAGRGASAGPAQTAAETPLKTIAVLPFQPISAESRDEILELGMADALITKLSNLKQVVVRPTSAVRKYMGLNQDPLAAGKEQMVESVLVGNVQKAGEMLRVTVQLLRVEDGRSLWADKFDVKSADIFAVQDAISEKVTNALAPQITGEELARLNKRYTENDEAYQLYQKGRFFYETNSAEAHRTALKYFEQAVEKDPNYALAYAGITESYIALTTMIGGGITKEDIAKAKAAGARAIELDENLAEPHHALADILQVYDWDWQGSEREYKRAIQLNPNNSEAHQSYSSYLVACGRFDEALAEGRRSIELDPISVQSRFNFALNLLGMRRYDESIAQLNETLKLRADYSVVRATLGRVYYLKGDYEEAYNQFQKVLSSGGDRHIAIVGLAQLYARTGRREEAQKLLDEILAKKNEYRIQNFYIAMIQASLGQIDEAFASLEKGIAEHELGMLFLKVDSRLDPLRSDPRFAVLMRKVGIPPEPAV